MHKLNFLIVFFICTTSVYSQDSLKLLKELRGLHYEILELKKAVDQSNLNYTTKQDSLMLLTAEGLHTANGLTDLQIAHAYRLDSLKSDFQSVHEQTERVILFHRKNGVLNTVLHLVSIILIMALSIFIILMRKQTFEYLVNSANLLSSQNSRITEEVMKLENAKKDVEALIDAEKKKLKTIRKLEKENKKLRSKRKK